MRRLRVLVVDDEPLIRKGLCQTLSRCADVEVVGECGSGKDAIQAIPEQRPDLILLDVRMPGCSGLEVVRTVGPKNMPAVIFVTGYDDYAVEAFELNAIDYVLKPFEERRLQESVEKARKRISQESQATMSQRLEELLESQTRKWAERLVVRNGSRYDFVATERIDWIESANNYVQLHCGGKRYLLGETLTSLERRLNPAKFARIHRGRIINTGRIAAVHPLLSGTYEIELLGGIRVTTGRQYKEVVQKLIQR